LKWCKETLTEAVKVLEAAGLLQEVAGGKGHKDVRVAKLAQERGPWRKWVETWRKKQGW